jgi:hypothetical protein
MVENKSSTRALSSCAKEEEEEEEEEEEVEEEKETRPSFPRIHFILSSSYLS